MRRYVAAATAALLALAACSGEGPAGGPTATGSNPTASAIGPTAVADFVFHNGTVLTMDADAPRADAIAIAGEEVLAVGTSEAMLAHVGDGTTVVDLEGFTVMPGFVDAHAHYIEYAGEDPVVLQDWLFSMGVTTVAELATYEETIQKVRGWEADGLLRARWNLYMVASNVCGDDLGDWYSEYEPTDERGELMRISGVKVYADGGACKVPATTDPATGEPSGDLFYDVDTLETVLRELDEQGYQIALHALGDRAIDTSLTAFERVIGDSGNPLRHRIEHNTVYRDDFDGRYDAIGLSGTIFGAYPTCTLLGWEGGYDGPAEGSPLAREWRWNSLLDGNPDSTFGWSSDGIVAWFQDPSPARSLFGFTTRRERTDDGGYCEPSAAMLQGVISPEQALWIMTAGSAYALHREDEVGSLRPGMLADITVWSVDPTTDPPDSYQDAAVALTMVGGKPEHCVGAPYDAHC